MESFYRAIFCFALLANPYAKTRRKMIQYCEIRDKMTECTGQDSTLHLLCTFFTFYYTCCLLPGMTIPLTLVSLILIKKTKNIQEK